jgi:hypothetical protein
MRQPLEIQSFTVRLRFYDLCKDIVDETRRCRSDRRDQSTDDVRSADDVRCSPKWSVAARTETDE